MPGDLVVSSNGGLLQYFSHLWPDFTLIWAFDEGGLNSIPPFFVGLLLLITAVTIIVVLLYGIKAVLSITNIQRQLAGLNADEVAAKRRELQEKFGRNLSRSRYINHAWQDFDETLVASTDGNRLYSTIPADQFFNTYRLAPEVTESRLLASVPSILLSVGVLGTFFGLTIGLKGIDIGAEADVATLREGIESMIGGAAIAFVTSVWGVFLSVLVNSYLKLWESAIRRKLYKLQIQVDQLFPSITAEGSLSDIANDSRESRMALQTLHEKIGEKMQEHLYAVGSSLQESLVQGIQEVMRESMDQLNAQAGQQSTETLERLVQQFMERMGETGAEQRRMLDASSETMQNTVNSLNVQMSSLMDRLSEQQTEADRRERDRQQALLGGIEQMGKTRTQTEESLSRLAQQQNEHSERLERASEGLLAELRGASEAMERSSAQLKSGAGSLEGVSGNLQQASNALKGPVEDMTTRIASLAEEMERIEKNIGLHIQLLDEIQQKTSKTSEGLSKSAELANNGFKELENHQNQFLTSLKQNLEGTNKELRSQVEDLAKQMENWLVQYGEQVSKQTQERMNEWDTQTRSFADNLYSTVKAINQVVDEIEGTVNRYAAR